MDKEAFNKLGITTHLRYLADIRGVPKDSIVVVKEIDQAGDGTGSKVQKICRVLVMKLPKDSRRMPFMDHLLTIYERDAEFLEKANDS